MKWLIQRYIDRAVNKAIDYIEENSYPDCRDYLLYRCVGTKTLEEARRLHKGV